jgi:quaternary ammonium compound-resistance protein SugE
MAWVILVFAGLLEIGWAVGLKYTAGFTRFWPSVGTLAGMGASVYLLALSVRELPVGTAYAVWTGIGALGTVILGVLVFGEPRSVGRLLCLGLIAAGIAGLKVTSAPEKQAAAHPPTTAAGR